MFTLEDLLNEQKTEACLTAVQTVSRSPNITVAASFFMRRIGMFLNTQFYNLAVYDEIWNGNENRLLFGAIEEYGNRTVSTYADASDWHTVEDNERQDAIRNLLLFAYKVIRQIRTIVSISPLTLWENIFGFLLWQYHVLLENPGTSENARKDLDVLKDDKTWEQIAPRSLLATYLQGYEPSELINTTVRTTCCLSKDVPGLMQCGFCPLKEQRRIR
ncbi:hypothetical protein [Sporosarcina sp. UB5]|uniref:hypothetical protein n=1 Tax=Sporosarcina sp. UB5 TaxID=3047463 RepID=UPI003D7B599C